VLFQSDRPKVFEGPWRLRPIVNGPRASQRTFCPLREGVASCPASPPWATLRGSEALLISRFELHVDELLGVELRGLPAPGHGTNVSGAGRAAPKLDARNERISDIF
jgi:hypothetical protein